MSPREEIQNRLVEWLEAYPARFTAPYGILPGLESLPKGGKVRTVTFGVARYLDATVYIWSPSKFTVRAAGPLAYKIDGNEYRSFDSLTEGLTQL